MTISEAEWCAVTSHHKWVFFRRIELNGRDVILYSRVELQQNSTRPFCALLAMILADRKDITIPEPPHEEILNVIESAPPLPENMDFNSDSPRHSQFKCNAIPSRSEPPTTCSKTEQAKEEVEERKGMNNLQASRISVLMTSLIQRL